MSKIKAHYEAMLGERGGRVPTLTVAGLPYQVAHGTYNLGDGYYCVLQPNTATDEQQAYIRALKDYVHSLSQPMLPLDDEPTTDETETMEAIDDES